MAEVIEKVKDTETINQADKTTALLIRAVHAALSPLEKWFLPDFLRVSIEFGAHLVEQTSWHG